MGLSRLGLHSSGQIPLYVVTVGLAHVCAVQPKVLVSDILLDVASRLRFEGGTLESTEGRGEHGTTEQNGADRGDIETKESKSIKREAVCEVTDRSTCILYVFHALSANLPFFHIPLCHRPHFSQGGGGVWPLSGGKCDQQSGFLPQRRPGAAPSAAFSRQHGGDGCA